MTSHPTRNEAFRWITSAIAIVGLHAACAAAIVTYRDPVVEPADAAGAIFIDLAPVATSAPPPPAELPAGPQQIQADAPPPPPPDKTTESPPEEKKEELAQTDPLTEKVPELPRIDHAEATLPATAQVQTPEPLPPEQQAPPAPETTAPQAIEAPLASVTAAPNASVPSQSDTTRMPQWTSRVAVLLERNKRYPTAARTRREEGTARVAFVLDRQGRIVSSRIEQSSGVEALDREALDLLQRAQPFPPLPTEIAEQQISLTVPIKFALR